MVCMTVCEQHNRECCQTVCKPVCETHYRDCCYNVRKQVCETVIKKRLLHRV